MNIEKHICELLFEHDCVIIPHFGGFVCNYSPAFIQEGKKQIHPPFKKISFNRNLKSNDGLLASQISQQEKISYSEATSFISKSVEHINKELNSDKRFELKNIGTFYLGEENTILFEQNFAMNYLPESFGHSIFYSPAIKRESIERKFEKKLQDKKIIPSKTPSTSLRGTKTKTSAIRYLAVAASLLIMASLVFVSAQTDLLKNVNFASLNPFAEKAIALYLPNNPVALPDVAKNNVSNLLALNKNDTTRYLNIMINGNIPIVVSLLEDKTTVKKIRNAKHKTQNKFQIIGGAFAVPENAEKFKRKLEKLGYDAVIIKKKLQLVSYGSYTSREDALQAIEKIRTVQQDVWLMIN